MAARAVQDDRGGVVRRRSLDARLEEPARDVHRARDASFDPFVLLADVHEQRPLVGGEELVGACGVHLLDLGAHLLQQLAIGRHDFQ